MRIAPKICALLAITGCNGGSSNLLADAARPDATAVHDGTDGAIADAALPDASVCGSTLLGSVVIHNSVDVNSLANFCAVTGDITIDAPGMTSIALPTIVAIGGVLSSTAAPDLTSLSLSALVTAGGISLSNVPTATVPVLSSLSVPKLATIGTLLLSGVATLPSATFPAMTTSTTFVYVGDATVAATFPALTTAAAVAVKGTALVTFDVLANATEFEVEFAATTAVAIPNLASTTTLILGGGSSGTSTFSAPKLTSATVDAHLLSGTLSADLHALTSGSIWVHDTTVEKLDLGSLTTLVTPAGGPACATTTYTGCSFFYANNQTTTALAFPKLTSAESILIAGDANTGAISMPSLASATSLVQINNVPSVSLPALITVQGEIDLGVTGAHTPDPRMTSFNLGGLQRATTLRVYVTAPAILPQLLTTSLVDLVGVNALDLSGLQSGSVVAADATFPQVQLPALVTTSVLYFKRIATLTTINVPAVAVADQFGVESITTLQSVSAVSLTSVQGDVVLGYVAALTTLNLPLLANVTGKLYLYDTKLATVSLPQLASVGPLLSFGYFGNANPDLTKLDLPSLKKVGPTNSGAVEVLSSPSLPKCQADKLNTQLTANGFTGTFTTANLGTGTCP